VGVASFTYTLSDGQPQNCCATGIVEVTITNDEPVALARTTTVAEDNGPVLYNPQSWADAWDPDFDPLTISATLTSGSELGTFSRTGWDFTFTPDPNESGAATVSWTVSDGLETATATWTIQVDAVNDPPVANPDGPIGVSLAGYLHVLPQAMRGNDTDVELDTLYVLSCYGGVGGLVSNNWGGSSNEPNDCVFFPTSVGAGGFSYDVCDRPIGDPVRRCATGWVTVQVEVL